MNRVGEGIGTRKIVQTNKYGITNDRSAKTEIKSILKNLQSNKPFTKDNFELLQFIEKNFPGNPSIQEALSSLYSEFPECKNNPADQVGGGETTKESKEEKAINKLAGELGIDPVENRELLKKVLEYSNNTTLFREIKLKIKEIINNKTKLLNLNNLKDIITNNKINNVDILNVRIHEKKASNAVNKLKEIKESGKSKIEIQRETETVLKELNGQQTTIKEYIEKIKQDGNIEDMKELLDILDTMSNDLANIEQEVTNIEKQHGIQIAKEYKTFLTDYKKFLAEAKTNLIADIKLAQERIDHYKMPSIKFVTRDSIGEQETNTAITKTIVKAQNSIKEAKSALEEKQAEEKKEANKLDKKTMEQRAIEKKAFNKKIENKLIEAKNEIKNQIDALKGKLSQIKENKDNQIERINIQSQIVSLLEISADLDTAIKELGKEDSPDNNASNIIKILTQADEKIENFKELEISKAIANVQGSLEKDAKIIDAVKFEKDFTVVCNMLKTYSENMSIKEKSEQTKELVKTFNEATARIRTQAKSVDEKDKAEKVIARMQIQLATTLAEIYLAGKEPTAQDIEQLMIALASANLPDDVKKRIMGNPATYNTLTNDRIYEFLTDEDVSKKQQESLIAILPTDKLEQLIKEKPELKNKIIMLLIKNNDIAKITDLLASGSIKIEDIIRAVGKGNIQNLPLALKDIIKKYLENKSDAFSRGLLALLK